MNVVPQRMGSFSSASASWRSRCRSLASTNESNRASKGRGELKSKAQVWMSGRECHDLGPHVAFDAEAAK